MNQDMDQNLDNLAVQVCIAMASLHYLISATSCSGFYPGFALPEIVFHLDFTVVGVRVYGCKILYSVPALLLCRTDSRVDDL